MRNVAKKTLFLLIIVSIILSACGNEKQEEVEEDLDNLNKEGFPIVDEPIELNFFAGVGTVDNDWNDILLLNEYEQMTNIKIEWEQVSADAREEKRNIALVTDDLPDVFYGTYIPDIDLLKYGERGTFIPLNDLIDEYAPNLKAIFEEYPEIEKSVTMADGNIYGLPRIYDPEFISRRFGSKPWIRGDWLEELGIENPETTEEFYEYLKAVKENDLIGDGENREIPLGGASIVRIVDWIQGAFGVGTWGRMHTTLDTDPNTDELRFYPITDDYKDMLEYLHKLYSEGLIEENIFSIETDQYLANAAQGLYGATPFYNPKDLFGEEEGEKFISANALEGPKGHKLLTGLVPPVRTMGQFSITKANKHPAATIRWMDYFYGEEGSKMFFMGIEGETYEETPDGPKLLDKITNSEEGLTRLQELSKYIIEPSGNHPVMITEEYYVGPEAEPEDLEAAERLSPYLIENPMPTLPYTLEENEMMSTTGAEISKFVNDNRDLFISGEKALSEWDEYVRTLEDMGLEEYMEVQEKAYERYLDN